MSPPPEKVGGHVPRVPHQIAPMVTRHTPEGNASNQIFSTNADAAITATFQ